MESITKHEPELSQEDFLLIRDFIHERCGIYFAENKLYLVKNRLLTRMTELGLREFRDYFYHVKYDMTQREFNQLMNLITTKETSFFRNEPQLLSLSEEVLPQLILEKKNSSKTLRIWSAGCSSGEEPYSIAILLMEKIPDITNWKIEIIANDISEQVLHKARLGEYSGATLRNVKPYYLVKYFDKSGETYRIKDSVKRLVKFSQVNLNDPKKIVMNNLDIIFCRNVMIYFSDEVRRHLVRHFYNTLKPGGYFYIGHSESLHGISKAFKLVYLKNALVYSKEDITKAVPAGVGDTAQMVNRRTVRTTFNTGHVSDVSQKAQALLQQVKKMPVSTG